MLLTFYLFNLHRNCVDVIYCTINTIIVFVWKEWRKSLKTSGKCLRQYMKNIVYAKWKICNDQILYQYIFGDKINSENFVNLWVNSLKIWIWNLPHSNWWNNEWQTSVIWYNQQGIPSVKRKWLLFWYMLWLMIFPYFWYQASFSNTFQLIINTKFIL